MESIASTPRFVVDQFYRRAAQTTVPKLYRRRLGIKQTYIALFHARTDTGGVSPGQSIQADLHQPPQHSTLVIIPGEDNPRPGEDWLTWTNVDEMGMPIPEGQWNYVGHRTLDQLNLRYDVPQAVLAAGAGLVAEPTFQALPLPALMPAMTLVLEGYKPYTLFYNTPGDWLAIECHPVHGTLVPDAQYLLIPADFLEAHYEEVTAP